MQMSYFAYSWIFIKLHFFQSFLNILPWKSKTWSEIIYLRGKTPNLIVKAFRHAKLIKTDLNLYVNISLSVSIATIDKSSILTTQPVEHSYICFDLTLVDSIGI